MKSVPFDFPKRRDFGAIIGDSLFFFTRNFRSFLLGFLLYIGPFVLIGSLAMIYAGIEFQRMMTSEFTLPFSLEFLAFLPFIVFASVMMLAFVCAMVQKQQQMLDEPLVEGIWPYVRRNIGKATSVFFTIFIILVVPYILLILLAVSLDIVFAMMFIIFLSIPVVIYLAVPLSIFMVAHMMENNTIMASLRRGFFLVKERWWITLGVYIVLSLLASIVSYILVIPAYVMFFIQMLGSASADQMPEGFGMWFGIMYACAYLGSLFAGMYQLVGMILQYYSLREQKEGTSLLKRIEALGQTTTEDYV